MKECRECQGHNAEIADHGVYTTYLFMLAKISLPSRIPLTVTAQFPVEQDDIGVDLGDVSGRVDRDPCVSELQRRSVVYPVFFVTDHVGVLERADELVLLVG